MPAQIRARPYKELLTPLLHRRFIKAAALILALCYVETIIIGDKSSPSLRYTVDCLSFPNPDQVFGPPRDTTDALLLRFLGLVVQRGLYLVCTGYRKLGCGGTGEYPYLDDVYVGQEPLKGGEPTTNDTKDPNGSLISGLKAKKLLPKRFQERRMSIFMDVDRPSGPVWTQILTECLKVVEDVPNRISNHQSAQNTNSNALDVNDLQSLPRISTSLKEEQVIIKGRPPSTRRERIESSLATMAKSYGDQPVQVSNGGPFSPKAKQYLALAQNKLLTHDQQQIMSQSGMKKVLNDYLERFLRSPLGEPFRQLFARRVASIAFGNPYTEVGLIVDAIDSLASLASSSLHEDRPGQVAKDVPLILRTFVRAHQTLSVFVNSLEVHWTDKGFQEEDRKCGDIGTLLSSLENGLRVLAKGFGEFARDIGLEDRDLKAARMIAGLPGE
ncbi:MAG: hypothetical protein Q9167_003273 [Letrouitia subvulpina]